MEEEEEEEEEEPETPAPQKAASAKAAAEAAAAAQAAAAEAAAAQAAAAEKKRKAAAKKKGGSPAAKGPKTWQARAKRGQLDWQVKQRAEAERTRARSASILARIPPSSDASSSEECIGTGAARRFRR